MRPIDADALIERWVVNGDYENSIYDGVFIIKTIEEAPTIEPRPRGKWIEVNDAYDRIRGRCSACGWEAHMYEDDVVGMPFCPNCGASMKTEVQDDSFFNDDITFCSYDRCTMKKCERHMSQIRDKSIPHSFANFEGCVWWPQKVVKNNEREIR